MLTTPLPSRLAVCSRYTQGRLSEEEIERMVREAEEYAEEDKAVKDRIDARNSLESYLYNMKNLLDDEEKGVSDKISEADKEVSLLVSIGWRRLIFGFRVKMYAVRETRQAIMAPVAEFSSQQLYIAHTFFVLFPSACLIFSRCSFPADALLFFFPSSCSTGARVDHQRGVGLARRDPRRGPGGPGGQEEGGGADRQPHHEGLVPTGTARRRGGGLRLWRRRVVKSTLARKHESKGEAGRDVRVDRVSSLPPLFPFFGFGLGFVVMTFGLLTGWV